MTISDQDFVFYKDLLYKKSGLSLTPEKSYLLIARLTPLARDRGCDSLEAFTALMRTQPDEAVIKQIVEAMTTNETLFFRDNKPYAMLKSYVLPYMMRQRDSKKSLRLWSAACSTGQEAFSLAMTIKDSLPNWQAEILGTDISTEVLERANKGIYTSFEVQRGLPAPLLLKHFTQLDGSWAIKDELKSMVKFQYLNLLDRIDHLGMFDIVFCRNVLIYFDVPTKTKVLEAISRRLAPDGVLFLGACETVMGLDLPLELLPNFNGMYVLKKSNHPLKKEILDKMPKLPQQMAGT
jgi:chemotaxis protein methyltransferase CheR